MTPSHDSRTPRSSSPWRLAAPAVFLVAGGLFVTSAVSSGGTDLRAGRYDDLGDVVEAEAAQLEELREKQAVLAAEVDQLTDGLDAATGGETREAVEVNEGPAGLKAVTGPGLTVTLDDAPESVQDTADVDGDDLVVHEQDIQGVVNALWSGGAEAMTIQGQRVISTTGIRCVGNTVILHDVPYAPPYVISAIGPVDEMLDSIDTSPYVDVYLEYVARFQLGWHVEIEPTLVAPAYAGSTELDYARPAGSDATLPDDTT
jgi:uncharacterized protein YlxW (UPF0749 family)